MSDPNDRYRPPGPDEPARYTPPTTPTPPPDETTVDAVPVPDETRYQQVSPAGSQPTSPYAPAPGTAYPPHDQPSYENAAWAPDASLSQPSPVQPPTPRRTGGPLRWIVALLVTVLVVGSVGAVAFFAARTSTPPSAALSYLPAETASYNEVRLDFPGDQREKVASFLAHFPGFADRATLDQGLDQSLDQLLKSASNDRYSYTGDVKPWFSGQLSLALLEFPDLRGGMGTLVTGGSTGAAPSPGTGFPAAATNMVRLLVILGVQDKAKAQTELDKILVDITASGASVVSSSRPDGTTIVTVSPPNGGSGVSYALTADAIVLASVTDDLHAALDRKTANGENLGKAPRFSENLAKLRGDRVGMTYLNTDAIRTQLASLAPAGRPGSALLSFLLTRVPSTTMSSFRFEADRFVADGINRAPQGATAGSGKDSGLTKRVPSDSLAYAEMADVGTFSRDLFTALKLDPLLQQAGPDVLQQIGTAEGILGTKLENYLDWLGNVAVTGGLSDGQPVVALVASVTDETVAKQRLDQLVAFAQLAGAGMAKISQQDYAGTKVTTFGLAGEAPSLPGNLPASISVAIKDGVFYLGLGEAYTKKLLDLKPENSLGQSQRFADAVKAAGGPATSGLFWVDLAAIRTTTEAFLSGEQRDKYEKEVKPYLVSLDQLIMVGVQDGPDQKLQFQFIVK